MRLPLKLKLEWRGKVLRGEGETLNLSSEGLYFRTQARLPIGSGVRLYVDWPLQRFAGGSTSLAISAEVVRIDHQGMGVKIRHYTFQHQNASAAAEALIHDAMLVAAQSGQTA